MNGPIPDFLWCCRITKSQISVQSCNGTIILSLRYEEFAVENARAAHGRGLRRRGAARLVVDHLAPHLLFKQRNFSYSCAIIGVRAFADWSCGDCSRRRIMFLLGAIKASAPDRAQAQKGGFHSRAPAGQSQRNSKWLWQRCPGVS
jgi:hypothetical protein